MKKSDLKTGMLVELRNGDICMLIGDTFVDNGQYLPLSDISEDLEEIYSETGCDIIKVSNVLCDNYCIPKYWTSKMLNKNLLWERKVEKPCAIIDGVEYSESTLRSLIKKATGA